MPLNGFTRMRMDLFPVLKLCLVLLFSLFMQVSGSIICLNRPGFRGFIDTLVSTSSQIECSGTCVQKLAGPIGCSKCCFQQRNKVEIPVSAGLKEKNAEGGTKQLAIGYIGLAVICTLILEAIFVSAVVYRNRFSHTNVWICKWWRTDTVPDNKAPICCREDLADIGNDNSLLPETQLSREESEGPFESLRMPMQETSSDSLLFKVEVC